MTLDFKQIQWDEQLQDDCRQLVRLAVREDLDRGHDLTTLALVPSDKTGTADVVARRAGIVAGQPAVRCVIEEMELDVQWREHAGDGAVVTAGFAVATIAGSARDILTAERLLLNLIGRLSGVASLARRYVEAVAGTKARIYDTRKTTPGWRRLEKYAVRCGGAMNHRTGLYDAVLVKDNHLALAARGHGEHSISLRDIVNQARAFADEIKARAGSREKVIVEIEVDNLEQLREVLPAEPDIVLLDNLTPAELRNAVAIRDELNRRVELEASGGIDLDTVRAVAETGIERISVGALTHSAVSLDFGLDWRTNDA